VRSVQTSLPNTVTGFKAALLETSSGCGGGGGSSTAAAATTTTTNGDRINRS